MIFVTLGRFKRKPTKEVVAESEKLVEKMAKAGIKLLGMYWTLGRYDVVIIAEGMDEKTYMKTIIEWGDIIATETLVAIAKEEAAKLLGA